MPLAWQGKLVLTMGLTLQSQTPLRQGQTHCSSLQLGFWAFQQRAILVRANFSHHQVLFRAVAC